MIKDIKHTVYLSLGSNLGNKISNLSQAIFNLKDSNIQIDSWNSNEKVKAGISSVYETKHWSQAPNEKHYPNYFNIACRVITPYKPVELLNKIKIIEKKIGRNLEKEKNSPREIDIDILFFDQEIIDMENLTIPHPRLSLRAFVLKPLSDIAPNFIHPVEKFSVVELFEKLSYLEKKSVKKVDGSMLEI